MLEKYSNHLVTLPSRYIGLHLHFVDKPVAIKRVTTERGYAIKNVIGHLQSIEC